MRFEVLGVPIDPLTLDEAVERARMMIKSRDKGYFVFCTVSTVLSAREDPNVERAIREASVVTPDGMPLVWLAKRRQPAPVTRVYGPDFMTEFSSKTAGTVSHFFLGGSEGVADALRDAMQKRHPGFQLAGHYAPTVRDPKQVDPHVVERINAARPDIVWVGLGHPKQELWMYAYRDDLDAPVLAGVGAAFDYLSGRKVEAPSWMKRAGLQWLHRLLREPRRLWRRYLVGNAVFVLLLLRDRLRRRD